MKLKEYQQSMSFSDLGQKSHIFQNKIKTCLSKTLLSHSKPDLIRMGMEVYINELGYMTKMVTMPMYGKNLLLQNHLTDDLET